MSDESASPDPPQPSIHVIVSDLRLSRSVFDALVDEATGLNRPVHQHIQEILGAHVLRRRGP